MKRTILLSATLAAVSGAAAPAMAQDWYGQFFGGVTFSDDARFSGAVGGSPQSVITNLDDGYNLGAAIGTTLPGLSFGGVSLRGEIELSYSENDVGSVNFSGNGPAPEANAGGDISSTYLFGNVIADFATGTKFTPYAGIGLGVAFVDQSVSYGTGVSINGNDEVFASQLILGGAYALNDKTSLFSDVRYIRSYDVAGTRTAPGSVARVSDDLSNVALNVGVRFKF
ncbi:outer membrane beta-barrel protein [uncultured Roseovarius sp.]|uniref:outer membrane protein n=1 Tax=uncultured Roseovarius sp. TaxID=293344 RepID=UPI0026347C69|nr:outer membrane beta-barrel protein [uncultured Roseovarius sp.]